jgi:cytidylate kinase
MIITIDGPVASGKSTIAQRLAHDLGFYYLYTGLLYRGIAYVLVHQYGYDDVALKSPRHEDVDAVLTAGRLVYRYENEQAQVWYDGVNITPFLKTKAVDATSSISSADPYVRAAILQLQVRIGHEHDVVADGRDMGTVVFPQAACKFFLTASPEVRAARWQADQQRAGIAYTFAEALQAVAMRDERDTTREHSPLKPAPDAIIVDNSDLDIAQTVAHMEHHARQKCSCL